MIAKKLFKENLYEPLFDRLRLNIQNDDYNSWLLNIVDLQLAEK